jgi:protein-tyrosine phosphatase
VQVTASSLTAGPRSRSCTLAHALIAEGRAHVIAGDLHSVSGRAGLAEALETTDHPRARWMVTDAPAAILAGEPLPPAPAAPAPARRRWSLRRS